MAVNGGLLDYVLLWDVSDMTSQDLKVAAAREAQRWPGPPVNPISPNPIPIDMAYYRPPVKPMPPLGGRDTRRGGGYVSLTNYNNLP